MMRRVEPLLWNFLPGSWRGTVPACLALLAFSGAFAQESNRVIRTIAHKPNQGVAVGSNHFYAISNTSVVKHDKITGAEVARWQADPRQADFRHLLHLNSATVIGDRLYCAHSRYPVDRNANTLERFDISGDKLSHEASLPMPRKHGSFTWIDRREDGTWWMCYAVYGAGNNRATTLVQCAREEGQFVEKQTWTFPEAVVKQWGKNSCSGGSWGPDGLLYTTGHDHAQTHVLKIGPTGALIYVRTEGNMGFFGQAIAWDRSVKERHLWGIVRGKGITVTSMASRPSAP